MSDHPDPMKWTHEYLAQLEEASKTIKERLNGVVPEIALVLGSGLGAFASHLTSPIEIKFSDACIPMPTVSGHEGKIISGYLGKKHVLCFSGRIHSFEGKAFLQVCFIPRLCSFIGVKILFLTNAVGGGKTWVKTPEGKIERQVVPIGSFVIIRDHLRFSRRDPVYETSWDDRLGNPKSSTSAIWSSRLSNIVRSVAADHKLPVFEGVFSWFSGPNYETPLEVETGIAMGSSSFGMSTAVEGIMAHSLGLEVVGVSVVTNLAAGLSPNPLNHDEVKEIANRQAHLFEKLVSLSMQNMNAKASKATESVEAPPSSLFIPAKFSTETIKANKFEEAINFLRAKGFATSADLSIQISFGAEEIKKSLQNVVEFKLKEIPNFPLTGISSSKGSLLSGKTQAGKTVVIAQSSTVEGFSGHQAAFITILFKLLGASSLLLQLIAGSSDIEKEAAKAVVPVGDTINFLADIPPHYVHNLSSVDAHKATSPLELFDSEQIDKISQLLSAPSKSIYSQFVGPCFPTLAEIQLTHAFAKSDLWGISSTDSAYIAHSLGLKVSAIAAVVIGTTIDTDDDILIDSTVEDASRISKIIKCELPIKTGYVHLALEQAEIAKLIAGSVLRVIEASDATAETSISQNGKISINFSYKPQMLFPFERNLTSPPIPEP
eukprot:TRINITY_DN4678_c0_g1_i1.p1 TRINITY_DN4678_c0_g1~~TRINITY_DN4678_c0_g1_i1.p1  ORF type:complete len:667 (-),score=344.74 TRINITY_DN4678_c0_g1_i1:854-2833(-)